MTTFTSTPASGGRGIQSLHPLPMSGWQRSYVIKRDNSAMENSGLRDSEPYDAILKLASVKMDRPNQSDINAGQWIKKLHSYCAYKAHLG